MRWTVGFDVKRSTRLLWAKRNTRLLWYNILVRFLTKRIFLNTTLLFTLSPNSHPSCLSIFPLSPILPFLFKGLLSFLPLTSRPRIASATAPPSWFIIAWKNPETAPFSRWLRKEYMCKATHWEDQKAWCILGLQEPHLQSPWREHKKTRLPFLFPTAHVFHPP